MSRWLELPTLQPILSRLRRELSPRLAYHSIEHTLDVMAEAVSFAEAELRTPHEIELIAHAAAYHDAGFLIARAGHEAEGARMASHELAPHFKSEDLQTISRMILDTKLLRTARGFRQIPSTPLSGYLLDADLANFGRTDFFDRLELAFREEQIPREVFLRKSHTIFIAHEWCTKIAKLRLAEGKRKNLLDLEAFIRQEKTDDVDPHETEKKGH